MRSWIATPQNKVPFLKVDNQIYVTSDPGEAMQYRSHSADRYVSYMPFSERLKNGQKNLHELNWHTN